MSGSAESGSHSALRLAEDFSGVGAKEVLGFAGLFAAGAWSWAAMVNGHVAHRSAVLWLGSVVHRLGLNEQWALSANHWLHGHGFIALCLLALAALAANAATGGRHAAINVTVLALAALTSIWSLEMTVLAFVGITVCLSSVALTLDHFEDPHLPGTAARAFLRWVQGPGLPLMAFFWVPMILLGLAINPLRDGAAQ